jgi:hypothetical protein
MTRHLADAMGIPHLDDVLKAEGVIPKTSYIDPHEEEMTRRGNEIAAMERSADDLALEGRDHGKKCDVVYEEGLDNARKIVDLAFNIDPARAPRAFEVAANFYKLALDAADSKRKAQLQAKELMLKQQKLELDRRMAGEQDAKTYDDRAAIVEDRNELIRQAIAAAKAGK